MSRRARFIAGLITLVLMAFSLAEGVWAASCMSMRSMSEPSAAVSQEMPSGPHCMHGNHDRHDRDDLPECPFGPPGSQGCVLSASLPASSVMEIATSPEGTVVGVASDAEPDLLLGSTLFHPPKS